MRTRSALRRLGDGQVSGDAGGDQRPQKRQRRKEENKSEAEEEQLTFLRSPGPRPRGTPKDGEVDRDDDHEEPEDDVHENEPASRWMLGADACARVAKRADGMEEAGQKLLEDARDGGEMTDMEFLLDSGERIRGHKLWLIQRCEYIRRAMSSGMQESRTGVFRVRDCSKGAFMVILEYLYTGRLGEDACLEQDWVELWVLQDLFGVEQMGNRLLDAVTRGNVEDAARVGVERGLTKLLERCVSLLYEGSSVDEALCFMRVVDMICELESDDIDTSALLRGAASCIVEMMDEHLANAEVQEGGCRSIRKIVLDNHANVLHAGEIGGVNAVILAMKNFKNNAALQIEGCNALGNLCVFEDAHDNFEQVQEFAGIKCVVEAMNEHTDNVEVQEYGCYALMRMLKGAGFLWPPVLADGVNAVIKAMKTHKNSPGLQSDGCGALARFFENAPTHVPSWKDEVRDHAVDAGAIEAIVDGMKAHMSVAGLQGRGCQALLLYSGGVNCQRAFQAGVIPLMLNAMNAHPNVCKVQHSCCAALASLGAAGPVYRRQIVENGGIETVVRALKLHKKHALVQSRGNQALGVLVANNAENSRRAGQAGAVQAVVSGMYFHRKMRDWDLQREGCFAIANLTLCDGENRRVAGEAGAVEAVLKAMKSRRSWIDSRIQSNGCEALGNLIVEHGENRRKALAMRATHYVQRAMQIHRTVGDVQVRGWYALNFLGIS